MKEKDMYPVMEEHLRTKLRDKEFGRNILSSTASQTDLLLPLFGAYIKPDVYAIGENRAGCFRILMGEGKSNCKGRDLDGVIWQGRSAQRFAHYVYIFFPEDEVTDKPVEKLLRQECDKFGLGLLLFDVQSKGVKEILSPTLSPFLLDKNSFSDFEKKNLIARERIRTNLGAKKGAEYVHLTTLRDLAILLKEKEQWKKEEVFGKAQHFLLPEYQKIVRTGEKCSLSKYDPKAWKPVIEGDIDKFKEIVERNLKTLVFFDLISTSNGDIDVKPLCRVMALLDEGNKYLKKTNRNIEEFLKYLLLISEETKKVTEGVYEILRVHSKIAVWAMRGVCPNHKGCNRDIECGFAKGWSSEGQPFPVELKYDSVKRVHKCKINGNSIEFKKLTVTSLLASSEDPEDRLFLPQYLKVLISESSLVKQEGRRHQWSLGIK